MLRGSLIPEAATISAPQKSLGDAVRADFPILSQTVHGSRPLLYLDSAATSQKPKPVLEKFFGAVQGGMRAGNVKEQYEDARREVAALLNSVPEEVVFTRGATEAINLVARGWGDSHVSEGDEIILSVMEHHSNLVPWQALAERTGAKLRFVPLTTDDQAYDLDALKRLINPGKTKIVAMNHVSNVLGCANPVKEVVELAHAANAVVMLDACQSVPHMPVDFKELGVDFLAASGHKMLGPTGIGFLCARRQHLEEMEPLFVGDGVTETVSVSLDPAEAPSLSPIPWRFEAGTPPLAEAIALGEACRYIRDLGMDRIHKYEGELGRYLWDSLGAIPGVVMYGPSPYSEAGKDRGALVAFNYPGVHANDLAFFLDQEGVAIRSGHHCTQPLHRTLGVPGSARASMYIYNTKADVDAFCKKLKKTLKMFSDMGFGVEEPSPCPLVSTPDPTLKDPGIDRPCTNLWPHLEEDSESEVSSES